MLIAHCSRLKFNSPYNRPLALGYDFWVVKPPVPGPTSQALLPKLKNLQKNPLEFLVELAQTYGGIAQIPIPLMNIFSLAEPSAVKQVLQDNAKNYSKKTLQFTTLALVTGQGLLTSDGEFWLRQRRMMQPAFHRSRIASFSTAMTQAALRLVERWKIRQGQAVDLDHEMMEMTLEIVGQTLFSADLSDAAGELVRATLTALDFVIYKAQNPLRPPLFVPTPRNREFKQALATLDNAVYKLIEERRRSQPKDDLLSMLLEARSEDGQAMTDLQLRDELITLIIAGHETVASALTWSWHLIAQHPEAQQKLHTELAQVLSGRTPVTEDLPKLPYTRAVFDEALRLYPPAWLITRRAIEDDEIGGYTIPKGSLIITSPYIVHRQPQVWPQPEAFRPERFLDEARVPRYAYIPFGGGPRLCIGNNFALLEGPLILATIAQHYRLLQASDQPVEAAPLVTIRPRGGLWMRLEKR